jgi:class 3 adenylate cyclase
VIGKKKFIYDLWGESVNTASRMESHGIPGQIQVSESTYNKLKDKFTFMERGILEVKGIGKIRSYFLIQKV